MVERYKHQRLVNKYNYMRQRVSALQEEINQTRDRSTRVLLMEQLESFNMPPLPPSNDQVIPDEMIDSRAKGLYDELKVQEDQMMAEGKLESSMMYEVDRMNVLNLLKVFEVEVTWGPDRDDSIVKDDEKDKEIASLRDENTSLQQQVIFFLSRPACWVCLTLFT